MTDILDAAIKPRKPREASFWQLVKKHMPPGWSATRLESKATLGVPDVLFQDERGDWHMVELKATDRRKVVISPHQVAFAAKHQRGSCWVAVKSTAPDMEGVFLYHGDGVVDLRLEGIDPKTAAYFFPAPVNWSRFFMALPSKGLSHTILPGQCRPEALGEQNDDVPLDR